ncbi:hemoglobin subunit beta-2-like isoform X2 [Hyla sarda]|uniref:hemoglobin subunit beta-2-like isoform X2 n=1 Tax=Hyla sarda TaxID=327740 RepID=UPI0024C2FE56|nr:hemoglobin subunit beta-2-like isoform X2 [Hyla sarda]
MLKKAHFSTLVQLCTKQHPSNLSSSYSPLIVTMVHWTAEERSAITSVWSKVNIDRDGPDALARLLIVYPWTQRYFSSFGNLSNPTAIAGNAKVSAHGKRVLSAIGDTIGHLDSVRSSLHNLSDIHAFKLHVDPENFRRFAEVLVIVLGTRLGKTFSPQVQHAVEKFFAVLVDGLSHSYHS